MCRRESPDRDERRSTSVATRSSPIETPNLPIFQRQPLSLRVTEILKRYILVEPLETGSRLPAERRLAETLSISRTVLREALGQLIADGILVRTTPRTLSVAPFDRLRVAAELAPLNDYDIVDQSLIELRVIIEVGAIELITRRADADDLGEIERWVTEGERSVVDSAELMGRVDLRFHTTLLRAAHNDAVNAFLPLIEQTLYQNVGAWLHHLGQRDHPEDHRVAAEHRQIFEAIKRGDRETARMVMLAHLAPYLRPEFRSGEHDRHGSTDAIAVIAPHAHLKS
jgi:GntR family transcriptional regulator, transcriptional repressor for pyruvate dehydrogenase complex